MNRPALALAAAFIAGTTLTNAAEAGIRLGFGMPLGTFVASPFSPGAQQRSAYTGPSAQKRMYTERKAREARIAAARQQAAAKQQAAAVAEARARKAKLAAAAKAEGGEGNVETVVSNNKPLTEAAPTIFVPGAPETVTSTATSDQVAEVALVGVIDDAIKIKAPTTQPIAPVAKAATTTVSVAQNTETKPVTTSSTKVKEVCRRFSAIVGGLIDIPCE